jgi:hypothetical protein
MTGGEDGSRPKNVSHNQVQNRMTDRIEKSVKERACCVVRHESVSFQSMQRNSIQVKKMRGKEPNIRVRRNDVDRLEES